MLKPLPVLKFSGSTCGPGGRGQSSVHLLVTCSPLLPQSWALSSLHSIPGCKSLLDGAPAGVGREGAQKPDNSFFPIQGFRTSFTPLCQNLPWVMVGVACNNGGEGGGWVEERELLTGPPRVGVQGSYPGADF